MKKEEYSGISKYVSGLSKKALIFGIVFVALIGLFNYWNQYTYLPWFTGRNLAIGWRGAVGTTAYLALPLVFWIFIVTLLNPIFHFKKQEMAVLYAMVFVAEIVSNIRFGFINAFNLVVNSWIGVGYRPTWPLEQVVEWVEANWGHAQYILPTPKYDAYVDPVTFLTRLPWAGGDWMVDWASISAKIWWQVLFLASLIFVWVFLFAILRRRMITEELHPFPIATAPVHLIESATGSSESKVPGILKNKYLWIGILVGTLMQAPNWYICVFRSYHVPWTDFRSTMQWDAAAAGIPILVVLTWSIPWVWAISLLTPIEVAGTFVGVWAVLGLILPMSLVNAGLYVFRYDVWNPGMMNDAFWMLDGWNNTLAEPNWLARYGFTPIAYAGYVWILVWMLYSGRRTLIASLKSIITPNPEIDKDEALPYRWLYIGLGLALAGVMVAAVLIGAIVWLVVFGLIVQAVAWIGYSRVRAEGGGFGTPGFVAPAWGAAQANAGAQYEMHYLTGNMWMSTGGHAHGSWASYATNWLAPIGDIHAGPMPWWDGHPLWIGLPAWYTLEKFKVADMTETKPRSILYGMAIALITIMIVTIGLNIGHGMLRNCYPWPNWAKGYGWTWGPQAMSAAYDGGYFLSEGAANVAAFEDVRLIGDPDFGWYILIWVGVFAALTMVRTRFPRFIFNPIGLIMAAGLSGMGSSFFVPMLTMLIVKVIVTRYVGVGVYEKMLLPIAVGLLVSHGIFAFVDMAVTPFASEGAGWGIFQEG